MVICRCWRKSWRTLGVQSVLMNDPWDQFPTHHFSLHSSMTTTTYATGNETLVHSSKISLSLSLQTMLCLLEHGANPNAVEPVNKASVLHLACEKGCSDIADLFIKYKANVNQKDGHGNTPLMAACKNGHLGIAQLLLQRYTWHE